MRIRGGSYFGCFLIGLFDVVALLLSIKVRLLQNQAEHSSSLLECTERSNYATMVLGIATVLLLLAHVVAVLIAVFGAFPKNDDGSIEGLRCRKLSVAGFICTWVIFLFVCLPLLHLHVKGRNVESSCIFKNRSYVLFGGIVCLVHAFFGIATYFTSAAATY